MMLINRNDGLRESLNLGPRSAEYIFRRNHPDFGVPMPAFGEAICKVREKGNRSEELLIEMNRLMNASFVKPRYITDPDTVYRLARELCAEKKDGRDAISPMDGLILATAMADPECRFFYTSDTKLSYNSDVLNLVSDFRSEAGSPPLAIHQIKKAVTAPLRCF